MNLIYYIILFLPALLFGLKAEADSQSSLKIRSARQAVWKISYSSGLYENIGTVFFISPKLLLTNFHVVDHLEDIKSASLSQEGNSRELSLKRPIALSALHDLALFEIEETVRDYLSFKDEFSDIKELYVLAHWKEMKKTGPVLLESDSFLFTVNHSSLNGTSGSPVLNKEGELLGIVSQGDKNLFQAVALDPLKQFAQGDIGLKCAQESLKDCVKKEIENLKEMAKQGHPQAQYNLADIYLNRDIVEGDLLEARQWIKRAAKQGYALAQHKLAEMYFYGNEGEKDLSKAKQWLELAAKQGHAQAQHNLADMYLNGDDGKKNLPKANKWMRLAAKTGYAPAQHSLAEMYLNGKGAIQDLSKPKQWRERVKQNLPQARQWMELAAKQGYAPAQTSLAKMYFDGKGIKQDLLQARQWMELAAKQGEVKAQYDLATMYLEGIGGKKDPLKAKQWLMLLAQQGHTPAQYALADMYFDGIGVKKDPFKAEQWLKRAKGQLGSSWAEQWLKRAEDIPVLSYVNQETGGSLKKCHAFFSKFKHRDNRKTLKRNI